MILTLIWKNDSMSGEQETWGNHQAAAESVVILIWTSVCVSVRLWELAFV